ncbi:MULTISPECIES: DUF1801 domain-containing protein [unclassified Rhodococcus (in: high G+C Gram-positive bacteria)]|uniref:DUF1801 domain-containing protein n=1 Tax=Rhodococcus sp. SJ-3 TaxID=3454628 RepID=UPI002DA8857A|nr:DUF1801 domain-containing protein [Rhodococcus sp. (in: high G+C Gram-positive bacteria)]
MAENKTANKTQPTDASVAEFLDAVQHPVRRADAWTLHDMMTEVTGQGAVMWGPSMVGFGRYHYRYESGREGDALAVGFSPRKSNLALYGLTIAPEAEQLLGTLGKYKAGAACLYVNKLTDVDLGVLTDLVRRGFTYMTTVQHRL